MVTIIRAAIAASRNFLGVVTHPRSGQHSGVDTFIFRDDAAPSSSTFRFWIRISLNSATIAVVRTGVAGSAQAGLAGLNTRRKGWHHGWM